MGLFSKKNKIISHTKEQAENESLKMQLKQFWEVIYKSEKELVITKQKLKIYKRKKNKLEHEIMEMKKDNQRLYEDNKLLRKHLRSIINGLDKNNIETK